MSSLRAQAWFQNNWDTSYFQSYGNVRSDVKSGDPIFYHNNLDNWNASIFAHPPDSSFSLGNNKTGSDVIQIIQRFLQQTQAPRCGSFIFIILKRQPDTSELSKLISDLQRNHVFVYTFSSTNAYGPRNSDAMFDLAVKTNGLCTFADDYPLSWNFYLGARVAHYSYQIYSSNTVIFGKGVATLPSFYSPPSGYNYCFFQFGLEDYDTLEQFVSIKTTLTADNGAETVVYVNRTMLSGTTYYDTFPSLLPNHNYEIKMEYEETSEEQRTV